MLTERTEQPVLCPKGWVIHCLWTRPHQILPQTLIVSLFFSIYRIHHCGRCRVQSSSRTHRYGRPLIPTRPTPLNSSQKFDLLDTKHLNTGTYGTFSFKPPQFPLSIYLQILVDSTFHSAVLNCLSFVYSYVMTSLSAKTPYCGFRITVPLFLDPHPAQTVFPSPSISRHLSQQRA